MALRAPACGLVAAGFTACGTSSPQPERTAQQAAPLLTGQAVRTVNLPPDILCPAGGFPHIDISVAAVPAADVGRANLGNKLLLAASCRNKPERQRHARHRSGLPGPRPTMATTVDGVEVTPPSGPLTVDFTAQPVGVSARQERGAG